MWYTCSLYEGNSSNGKLLFQRKVQIKAGTEGINHYRLEKKFVNRYAQHLKPGYILMMDEKHGVGIGFPYTGPYRYCYIKYKGQPIKVERDGGFSIGEWDGWMCGIGDVTRFPQKRYAVDNLKVLRRMRGGETNKDFKLVKVKVR